MMEWIENWMWHYSPGWILRWRVVVVVIWIRVLVGAEFSRHDVMRERFEQRLIVLHRSIDSILVPPFWLSVFAALFRFRFLSPKLTLSLIIIIFKISSSIFLSKKRYIDTNQQLIKFQPWNNLINFKKV